MLMDIAWTALFVFHIIVLAYFVILNGYYFGTSLISFRALRRYSRGLNASDSADIMRFGGAPPVSILVPAYNEAANCLGALRSLLDLEYPSYDIIFINDGSTDDTLARLTAAYDLEPAYRNRTSLLGSNVRGVYQSATHSQLWVIDKANGGKPDALNVGLDYCHTPLFCSLDADTALERDALLRLCRSFLENADTIAAGGIVRVANGSTFSSGHVRDVRLPDSLLARFQVVEYLRAFLAGRMGWSSGQVLLIVSGAFGMFRRDVVAAAGGYSTVSVGRGHGADRPAAPPHAGGEAAVQHQASCRTPWRGTEVPESLRVLARQRDRWQRGLLQSLSAHRVMLLNPKYGRIGMIAYPYFWFMEGLGPVIEVLGYLAFTIAILFGWVAPEFVVAFLLLGLFSGIALSLAAVGLEELSFRRYTGRHDFGRLLLLSVLENFGYRQYLALARFRGVIMAVLGRRSWGVMEKRGVLERQADAPPLTAAATGTAAAAAVASAAAGFCCCRARRGGPWCRPSGRPRRVGEGPVMTRSIVLVAGMVLAATAVSPPVMQCPDVEDAYAVTGWNDYRADRIGAAQRAFRAALGRCPDHVESGVGLGYVALRQAELAEARSRFTQALQANPSHVDAVTGLGLVEWRAGRYEAAAGLFTRALALDPARSDVRQHLAALPELPGPRPVRPPLVRPDTLVYTARVNGERFEVRTARGWAPFYVNGVNIGAGAAGPVPEPVPGLRHVPAVDRGHRGDGREHGARLHAAPACLLRRAGSAQLGEPGAAPLAAPRAYGRSCRRATTTTTTRGRASSSARCAASSTCSTAGRTSSRDRATPPAGTRRTSPAGPSAWSSAGSGAVLCGGVQRAGRVPHRVARRILPHRRRAGHGRLAGGGHGACGGVRDADVRCAASRRLHELADAGPHAAPRGDRRAGGTDHPRHAVRPEPPRPQRGRGRPGRGAGPDDGGVPRRLLRGVPRLPVLPDFFLHDPVYGAARSPWGTSSYYGYLQDLKKHYPACRCSSRSTAFRPAGARRTSTPRAGTTAATRKRRRPKSMRG
jgi:cellulose synthase/poly-beta-1,6-N-acetylglucosamine synthase-like glycosyltransferase/tetratricopeptide (TPR) repeat protein